MRLLIVASNFPPVLGGIQTYAYEVASQLAARCAELLVVAPRSPGFRAHDATAPFEILRLPALGDDLAFSGILPLAALLRRRRFDAALTTHWAPGFALLAAAQLARVRVPLLVAAHGKELIHRPLARVPIAQTAYDTIRAHVLHTADALLPVSRRTAELLRAAGVPAHKLTVAHNGVDPARFQPRASGALRAQVGGHGPLLLSVARLVSRKGIDTVLRALPSVIERAPDVRYAIVGNGPDRSRLQALAQQLSLGEHVHFLASVHEDLAAYYNGCDLFVLPAREEPGDIEGFGLVFLEAGACEKPVIGARAGGVTDAILHPQTGLLVPPDDPAALATAIAELLADPARASVMGRAARARILREGTWHHAADTIFHTIERVASTVDRSC